MQRGLNEEARRELDGRDSSLAANENWSLKITCHVAKSSKYSIFHDYINCQSLRYGRMSFGGFNKPLEKLLREAANEEKDSDSDGADVNDQEMAEHLSLNSTVAKKFKRKSDKGLDGGLASKKRKLTPPEPHSSTSTTVGKFLKPTL